MLQFKGKFALERTGLSDDWLCTASIVAKQILRDISGVALLSHIPRCA
jgi:hypothetical protein